MPKLPNRAQAVPTEDGLLQQVQSLSLEVAAMREALDELKRQVRTREVLVEDADGTPAISLRVVDGHGRVEVGHGHGRVVLDAHPNGASFLDVLTGPEGATTGAHLHATDGVAGVALSAHGNIWHDLHIETDGEGTTVLGTSDRH